MEMLLFFSKVPIAPLLEDGDTGLGLKELFRMKIFWILLIMMICAGTSEQAVSQWASTFCRKRSWNFKGSRRLSRADGICDSNGNIKIVLW